MARFKIKYSGQEIEIEALRQGNTIHVTYLGKETDLRLIHQDGVHLLLERDLPGGAIQRIRVAGTTDGDKRQLWIDGKNFTYQLLQRGRGVAAEDLGPSLTASIPAVVSQILVAVGDAVQVGDKLILLESMKMVIPIQAPCDGKVMAISCAAGDAVQPGVQLIEIKGEDS
jgi:acetyl/propionyl-CoA carboxylase alpha subunit